MTEQVLAEQRIGQNTEVTLHFALRLENGDTVDSTFDKAPATFKVGDGNLLPGFEAALFGFKAGDKRTLTVEFKGEKQSVDVIWRDPDQYKAWLSKDLPAMLAAMDPGYDKDAWLKITRRISSEVTATKYEFPIAFHSKR